MNLWVGAGRWMSAGRRRCMVAVLAIAALACLPAPLVADARMADAAASVVPLASASAVRAEVPAPARDAPDRQPPPIPSPFIRFYSMLVFSVLAYGLQWFLGDPKDYRMALRHGMAGGFILSGVDHFVNPLTRYVPMLPDFLAPHGAALVYGTGFAELAGALGLIVPLAVYRRLGLPDLRWWAGIGIAVMLVCLVVANINVTVKASRGSAYAYSAWAYWLRLLLQPLFIAWALYAAGVIGAGTRKTR